VRQKKQGAKLPGKRREASENPQPGRREVRKNFSAVPHRPGVIEQGPNAIQESLGRRNTNKNAIER